MECEILCSKTIARKAKEGEPAEEAGVINFSLGIVSAFFKNGKIIEEHIYEEAFNDLKEDFLKMELKDKLELLFIIFKKRLNYRLKYIKLTEDDKIYTYRGQKMMEM